LWGLGKVVFDDDPQIKMTASASRIERICFNKNSFGLPAGFNAAIVSHGEGDLDKTSIERRGRSDFKDLTADDPVLTNDDWKTYECPNRHWTPVLTFVYWDLVKIETTGTDKTNEYFFRCTTKKNEPEEVVEGSFMRKGTIECIQVEKEQLTEEEYKRLHPDEA
jgi:hypothetical protein